MEVLRQVQDVWETAKDNMPSIRALSAAALSVVGSAQSVLALNTPLYRSTGFNSAASTSCTGGQTSCRNTSTVSDLCCFNAPGGLLLQTQFWDTNPSTGPTNSWTLHGLWPDNCDGTYQANCDSSRAYTNITQILQQAGQQDLLNYMNTYWPDYQGNNENFWEHEWGKHGTCISTLQPNCYQNYYATEEVPDYFNKAVALFKNLPTYDWLKSAGIVPSSSTTYSLSAIQSALSQQRNGHNVYLGCQSGALTEVWYFFNVQGSAQDGTYYATDVVGSTGSCPSSGIKYLSKSGSPAPTTTSTTSAGSSPTSSPGTGFSGTGYLNVVSGGSQNGCIISGGTWYTTGTCATITATTVSGGFTLKSSKGNCGIVSGALSCASGNSATVFTSSGSNLVYNSQATFYADGTPSGSQQATVYTSSSHSTSLQIQWQSK